MSSLLIIEDGSASSASANSFVTVAEVDAYCENMGYTSWASLATLAKEQAILRGMVFIDCLNYKGWKTSFENPLSWPRGGVYGDVRSDPYSLSYWSEYPTNEIPKALKRGCCEAAYEESVTAGVLLPTGDDNIKRTKIDVIEVEYFTNATSKKVFSKILALMSEILQKTGSRTANILRT